MDYRLNNLAGLRVVRGHDWQLRDEDGGEGHVGTLVEISESSTTVMIQWDCGNRCSYHCGIDGKFKLRVLDSGPTGKTDRPCCL